MTILRHSRRSFLKSVAATSGAALLASRLPRPLAVRAATPSGPDLSGLRDKIDHIIVIFQENRSFDHYFGAYQRPGGGPVAGLLDREGRIDARFTGLQKNAAGVPYGHLPVPYEVPGFANALIENRPFYLTPYIRPDANVPWDPMHHFFRMFAQINQGKMDRFVALAPPGKRVFFDKGPGNDPAQMMFAASTPSGAVLGFYTRKDLPFYHHLADEYVLFDHFFQAMSGGSTGNALYLVAGRSAQWSKPPAARPAASTRQFSTSLTTRTGCSSTTCRRSMGRRKRSWDRSICARRPRSRPIRTSATGSTLLRSPGPGTTRAGTRSSRGPRRRLSAPATARSLSTRRLYTSRTTTRSSICRAGLPMCKPAACATARTSSRISRPAGYRRCAF